jgi:hypothetical protein
MKRRTSEAFMVAFAALMLAISFAPETFASSPTVDLTLYSSSCTLNPPNSCTYTCPIPNQCGYVSNLNDLGYACLKWTSDSHIAASVTSHQIGSPMSDSNPTCPVGYRDWTFGLVVSYVAQTCTKGSYTVTFTAYKNSTDYVTRTFTATVSHCPFSP